MIAPIETSRLTLRPFRLDDVQVAFQWLGDPLVMRFTPRGPDRDVKQTAERIGRYQEHQSQYGYSRWMVIDQVSQVPVGDAGLTYLPGYNWIDFGYRLARPFWARGLATEAASAWIDKAFGELRLDCLVAISHPDNSPSLNVLRKLGFVEGRRRAVMGMDSRVFSMTADAAKR